MNIDGEGEGEGDGDVNREGSGILVKPKEEKVLANSPAVNTNPQLWSQNPQSPVSTTSASPQWETPFLTGVLQSINTNTHNVEVVYPPHSSTTRQWRWVEDEVLISGWMLYGKNIAIGNDATGFWGTVWEHCCAKNATFFRNRTPNAVKKRWHSINTKCAYFEECHARQSGTNNIIQMQMAHAEFEKKYNIKFIMERHWRFLRSEPKWTCYLAANESLKRAKTNTNGEYTSSHGSSKRSNTNPEEVDFNIQWSEGRDTPEKKRAASSSSGQKQVLEAKILEKEMQNMSTQTESVLMQQHRDYKEMKMEELKVKKQELLVRLMEKDTSNMNESTLPLHEKLIANLMAELNYL